MPKHSPFAPSRGRRMPWAKALIKTSQTLGTTAGCSEATSSAKRRSLANASGPASYQSCNCLILSRRPSTFSAAIAPHAAASPIVGRVPLAIVSRRPTL